MKTRLPFWLPLPWPIHGLINKWSEPRYNSSWSRGRSFVLKESGQTLTGLSWDQSQWSREPTWKAGFLSRPGPLGHFDWQNTLLSSKVSRLLLQFYTLCFHNSGPCLVIVFISKKNRWRDKTSRRYSVPWILGNPSRCSQSGPSRFNLGLRHNWRDIFWRWVNWQGYHGS